MPRSLILVGLLACAFAPAPQESSNRPELSDRQKEFVKEVQKNVDLADKLALQKLFRRETPMAQSIVETYCDQYANTGDVTLFDDIKVVIEQVDIAKDEKCMQRRVEYLRKIKDERAAWIEMKQRYNAVWPRWDEAETKKEEAIWKQTATAFEEVVNMAAKVGDLEISTICRFHLAICQDNSSQYEAAAASCKKAMEEWEPAGRTHNDQYKWMENRLAELTKKGYGPDAKPKDGKGEPSAPPTAPAKTYSKTSYKEGSKFQEWTGEYKEMSSPDQLPSISPWNSEYFQLWREFNFQEKGGPFALGTLAQAAPFGQPLKIVRDGSHAFIRQGDDKKTDVPVKILDSKPTLASLKGEKEGERYAVFLATGGQSATFMQTPMNYQTLGRYRSGWYREAKVLGETLVLLDDNSSGVIGDALEAKDNITSGFPEYVDLDGLLVGKKLMPCSDVVTIGGKWYHLDLSGDVHGRQIRTRELAIETGSVVLKWNGPVAPRTLVVAEMHEMKGSYFDVAGGKPVAIPVGHYQIAYGEITTGKGTQTKQAWIYRGESKQFDVEAGQTVTLDMGAPYKLDFELKNEPKQVTVKGKLLVHDKSGAVLGRIVDDVLYPEVWTRTGTTGNGTPGKPMAKIDSKTLNADSVAIWYPANYVIDRTKEQKLQVQLKLAKHPLLGGPFASDWK